MSKFFPGKLLYLNTSNGVKFRIDNFIVFFYFFYLLIALSGYFFVKYNCLNFITLFIYFIYVLFLYFGAFIGIRLKINFIKTQKNIKINQSKVLKILFFYAFITLLIWKKFIDEYGSIEAILANAYVIRDSSIGESESIIPVWLNYLSSTQYAFFAILLILYSKTKKFVWALLFMFLIILLSDLQSFGRIGILFTIFCVVGCVLLYGRNVFTFKNSVYTFILYNLLMLPRLIRGGFDNFAGTVDVFTTYFLVKIPPYFYGLVSIYIYYFSSIFAFNELLNFEVNHLYGAKNFAPLVNILRRIFPFMSIDRVQLIEPMANIPFEYNIYSILGDIYKDFGFLGFVVLPFFFGFIIGAVFRLKGFFIDSLKLLFFAWIFYSPIYNCFSFGSFFISFCFLTFLCLFFKES